MIFFKKNNIILDCFTSEPGVAEVFSVGSIINNMPSWWKSCPNSTPTHDFPVELSTIKRCPGIKDLFKTALVIPAWNEYILYKDPAQGFSHIGPTRLAEGMQHQSGQLGDLYKDYFHFKFVSPWYFKEKSGINWLMTTPTWHSNTDILVPQGVIEFKTQHSTHVNIVSKKEQVLKEYKIKAGDPLAYLIPLTESNVKVKIHVVSQEEIRKMKNFHHSFYNSYEITKRILK